MLLRILSASCLVLFCFAASAEEQHLDADGVKIRFTVDGEGEPVVLVHGFGANAEFNWRLPGITAALAKQHQVIALDVRGHGKSGKPHEREAYGVEMAADVIRVMNHLKIEKAHIVGYSMGGFITMKLIADHPDRFISAVLGGSGGIRDDYVHDWNDAAAEKLEAGESLKDALLSSLPDGVELDEQQLAMMDAFFNNQDPKALAAVLASWRDLSVSYEKLEANKIPTLVIYGSEEDTNTRTYIASLESRMSSSEFQLIDGADHMTAIASPLFRDSILKFIEANVSR